MFEFGKNWEKYSRENLDKTKIEAAKNSLVFLLKQKSLKNKSFLDIGSGTGIFSIAASLLGAKPVVAIDIDLKCILVAEKNARRFLKMKNKPKFIHLSILETEKVKKLGQFRIVYAWGSLHHTGKMEETIKIAAERVKKNGIFVLAIYNKHWSSPFWKMIKFTYNILPYFCRQIFNYLFWPIIFLAKFLVTGKNPLAKERGMDFFIDLIDWLGGYPYQYAAKDEVKKIMRRMGFKLIRFIPAAVPTGCNEFLFRKSTN